MATPATIRNLICHIYPRRKGGKWRRVVEHLRQRRSQFDGLRLVTVATDDHCDSASEVVDAFGDFECEFRFRKNLAGLGEVAGFIPMLERVIDEPGITFYCHSKGATHPDESSAAHLWCDAMAEICLDYPGIVDAALTGAATCGAFRSFGWWHHPGYHGWHFAGTFYWFHNERARQKPWSRVVRDFYGVEAWPGIFPPEESVCLFYDKANGSELYCHDLWRERVTPALGWWRKRLAQCDLSPASAASASTARQASEARKVPISQVSEFSTGAATG
jgi:hypothetical protein